MEKDPSSSKIDNRPKPAAHLNSPISNQPPSSIDPHPKCTTMQNPPSSKIDLETFVKDERRHPEPACRYLATHRNNYLDIPFGELITVPLYTTLIDLQRLSPSKVKHLAKITSARLNGDFVKALAKYCKGLGTLQRAAALFGAAHLPLFVRCSN